MRKTLVYLWLQVKKAVKALPAVAVTALVISGAIVLLFFMMKSIGNITDPDEPLKVGIVGNTNDEYFAVGLAAMKHFDSSRFAVEMEELTEEEARRLVMKGAISGYAVIPEGFVDSIMTGENKKITLVTTNASRDLLSSLVIEFTDQISGYLLETQNSIYGLSSYLNDAGITDRSAAINEINLFYVNLVMRRDDLFEPIEIIDEGSSVSQAAGYICGLTIFLVMLFGIAYSPVYTRRELSLNAVLRSRGVGTVRQSLCEYLSYLLVMLLCIIPIISTLVFAIHRSGIVIAEWESGFIEDYIYFVAGYIPVIIMFASMQYMLFLAADNFIAGVSLQFICSVLLAYLGGCLYPLSFFPEMIRKLAPYQPAGAAYEHLSRILLVKDTDGPLIKMGIYAVLFFAVSIFIMNRRLKYEK
ncbi:MAG: ABC transporter permease [Lachnospiraceae bacterium]|nr:ABC transporter permease [Lachnospiraceae bacterium]